MILIHIQLCLQFKINKYKTPYGTLFVKLLLIKSALCTTKKAMSLEIFLNCQLADVFHCSPGGEGGQYTRRTSFYLRSSLIYTILRQLYILIYKILSSRDTQLCSQMIVHLSYNSWKINFAHINSVFENLFFLSKC